MPSLLTNEFGLKYHGSVHMTATFASDRLSHRRAPSKVFHPDDRERVICELHRAPIKRSPHETESRLPGKGRQVSLVSFSATTRCEMNQDSCAMVCGGHRYRGSHAGGRAPQSENVSCVKKSKTSMFEDIIGLLPLQALLSLVSKVARN